MVMAIMWRWGGVGHEPAFLQRPLSSRGWPPRPDAACPAAAGAAHAVRKAPSSLASAKVPAAQSKRGLGHSRGSSKSVSSSKSASSLASKSMNSLAAAAANGKATLPLDKASKGLTGARPASASRLATQLQQH